MIYSSLIFIYGFLPLSLLIYYVCPKKYREYSLLFMSAVYCAAWGIGYLLYMTAFTAFNYIGCLSVQNLRKKGKKYYLPYWLCVFADIAAAVGFRSQFSDETADFLNLPHGFFPIGISFFTLSAIGVLTDVYNGKTKFSGNPTRFILYIIYFPKIIMGPLVRYNAFSKMLDKNNAGLDSIGRGMGTFVKGLAKKVIVADGLYSLYTAVNSTDIRNIAALNAWLGVIAYILCLYFTLSGFADMGIGISRCFGIKLPTCFNYPLFSTSIRGFSSSWNIQLVLWFRRYFFKPVASLNRKNFFKIIIFTSAWSLIGLWFKFSINGLIWGIITAAAIMTEKKIKAVKAQNITGLFYTIVFAVMGGILFSQANPSDAFAYLLSFFGRSGEFADQLSLYLLKSYIVLILAAAYASTNLFRNTLAKAESTKVSVLIEVLSPVTVLLLLMLCTAFISYNGASEMILIKF